MFRIESSELVVDPLPTPQNRRALLLYEAAEGGAGVLNRLATDRGQLALVARLALSTMHYEVPAGTFVANDLKDLAGAQAGETAHPCEAGCYQCLLSYYNQPDHEKIDRRNGQAVALLVALANATVQPFHLEVPPSSPSDGETDSTISSWLEHVSRLGLRKPDKLAVPVNGGQADAAYQSARSLVFLTPPDDSTVTHAQDRGFNVIVFPPDQAHWPAIFDQHASTFGRVMLP